ncbi:hypothetical protein [Pseudonocardia phyllosphaerae]|uniref:hypothetical protein n=1 Tax=Pseudonocardia phyllosphaerae TaxID=3390502 RepID=UPI00397B795B
MDRRIRVLIVRRRLETAAADLVERATGTRPARHSYVAVRLMLILSYTDTYHWEARYGLARQAARVYSATSAALHSNRAFGDIPEHEVQGWEKVVEEFISTANNKI